jgi:AAA15 family ATPase/GTPase
MLVQFTINNFRSFHEPSTLSMLATKRRSKNKSLDEGAVFSTTGQTPMMNSLSLLKTAAIYGANGSGKSNLISGIQFVKRFVIESSKESQIGEPIGVTPFKLLTNNDEEACSFEITFVQNKVMYQYSFSVDTKSVISETLLKRGPRNKRDVLLFSRKNEQITVTKDFPEGDLLEKKTRNNSLFLSVCANFSGAISSDILDWFRSVRVIRGQNDNGYKSFTFRLLKDETWNKNIIDLISKFDLGIERLQIKSEDISSGNSEDVAINKLPRFAAPEIASYHNRFDKDGKLVDQIALDFISQESQGTQKLVALAGPLLDTLANSYILIIDEFDSRLHPLMSRKILELFNSSNNVRNAQLIVATHDSNLLDRELLRRDQIWFVEKDFVGGSHLHSLVEYKIRNDASFETDYIAGKYGAIPILGDIRKIFRDQRAPKSEDVLGTGEE